MKHLPPLSRRAVLRKLTESGGTQLRRLQLIWRLLQQGRQPQPATPIFIVSAPRSGSNLLGSYLSSHPDITYLDELFRPLAYPVGIPSWLPAPWIRWYIRFLCRHTTTRYLSLKIFAYQLPDSLLRRLQASWPDARWIVLQRTDVLAQYASHLEARRTGNWLRHSSDMASITIPIDSCIAYAQLQQQAFQRVLRSLQHNTYSLRYEQLTSDPQILVQLLDALDLPAADLHTNLQQQRTVDLSQIITNYTAARKQLTAMV